MKTPQEFLCRLTEIIASAEFITKYRTKASYFTRNSAKLTFDKLFIFLLSLPRQSAQAAINRFIKEMEYDFSMHKQSLFEAREKLSHRIFVDLNNDYFLDDCAYSGSFKTYRGFRLAALDGSVLSVPYGADYFGTLTTVGEPIPRAQAVAITDVLNDYVIRAQLKPYGVGETNIAKEMLVEFLNTDKQNNLLLFDRGFFSREFARLLYDKAKFVFRVARVSLKDFNNALEPDQIIVRSDKGQPDLRLRVINYVLPTGEIEKLVTNIFDDSFTVEDFGNIYKMRWGVEVCFLSLKERLQIENFSSTKRELILQDFHAAIFVYNLMASVINEAGEPPETSPEGKKYKHKRKINKNLAAPEIRNLLIDTFLHDDPGKRKAMFEQVTAEILRNTVPIRPGRSYSRTPKRTPAKFPFNMKRGLA